jgi:hypothetical protein
MPVKRPEVKTGVPSQVIKKLLATEQDTQVRRSYCVLCAALGRLPSEKPTVPGPPCLQAQPTMSQSADLELNLDDLEAQIALVSRLCAAAWHASCLAW